MHKAPCGRARRGDRLGPSPEPPIRANCLNLNQKKCKFLYDPDTRPCGSPFTPSLFGPLTSRENPGPEGECPSGYGSRIPSCGIPYGQESEAIRPPAVPPL